MEPKTTQRILRDAAVQERTGLSKSTRWRLERDGKFPQRVRLSANAVGWREEEINHWLESRKIVISEGTEK